MSAQTDESTVSKVRSSDGTEIAYWTSGDGPPLLVIHHSVADHTRFRPMLPFLEPHVTVHAMDRRGRGGSGDAARYDLAREYEDVAVVVDAIAEASGSKVDVYGHSHGGFCAFGAAQLTTNIRSLVLYEGWPAPDPSVYALPADVEARMDALLAAGDREGVVEAFFRDVLMMSDEDLRVWRDAPSWPGRVAAAHTITRECRAEVATPLDWTAASRIAVPVLLLTGGESPESFRGDIETVSDALPDAHIVVLEGQQHIADVLVPDVFWNHVLSFLRDLR
jgi:pimeloyl-ACP methyl ester carboxylesterase